MKNAPQLNDLCVFCLVARKSGFAAAAEEQPTSANASDCSRRAWA